MVGNGRAPRLALILPPMVLIAVVALGVAGRSPATPPRPSATVVAAAPIEARAPFATPSPRSDWPAAIAARNPAPRQREEGTDGLLGRLAFGLPGDTPYARPAPVNRFTLDDTRTSWSGLDSTPPWVRRLSVLGNDRADPSRR